MSERLQNLINIFLKSNETSVVYAHSGHITKMPEIDNLETDLPLGYYLKKIYNDQFFSMSFQIGSGAYTQDECSINSKLITETLAAPPSYSFEYAGLATGLNYFYYPSLYFGSNILSCREIPRASRYSDLNRFSSLKKRFDGFVFIKESTGIDDIESSPMLYNIDYFALKRNSMDRIIGEISN